jgi:anti-sigma factor ChrR (cupin superfamily)
MTNQDYCFCDLAPFYALGLLSDSERAWVEQQVADCPDLAEDIEAYQLAVTAIPYSTSLEPLDQALKTQLFERLSQDVPPSKPDAEPTLERVAQPYLAVRSHDLHWQPHPVPGITVAIVHTDPVKREIVGFLRAEPGACYPWHRHMASEEIFMLEGDLIIGDEVFGPGDYIHSLPGSSHAPYTRGGCQFIIHTSMDDEYPDLALPASR